MEDVLGATKKVAVMGGGSFGTAMATLLARNKGDLDVVILLRNEDDARQALVHVSLARAFARLRQSLHVTYTRRHVVMYTEQTLVCERLEKQTGMKKAASAPAAFIK